MPDRPKVGVGVILVRDGKVLLGKRISSHGQGDWCFPGGHLEMFETFHECAAREALEETGIVVAATTFAGATNDFFPEKHYVTIYMRAISFDGEPEVREKEKSECWQWFSWDSLPEPLFLPIRNLIGQGYDPKNRLRP